ncbi:TraB/GumN family protein [Hymenobacter sp. HSC-4F20]|uniref:TraB/GumN family protein n=1 Tax=Hymenobacter sp. HSC-4F20 TaxID=2864135 RepID=UPI001C72A1B5|nr:TraB/GumN family protein [Hymenobacter sp. HSC-4F20]MBX0291292.1 TraB/GumN family protein [Hymenobacter sp. HSC-4F20]
MHLFRNILLLSMLLAAGSGRGQKSKSTPRPEAASNALLWKISGKGLPQPSYLYGTIHLICAQDVRLSEPVKRAVNASRRITLELDMDSPTLRQDMQAAMKMRNGQTLHKLLRPREYTRISHYLKDKVGIPIAQVGMLKPFLVSSLLYSNLLGCTPISYESVLVKLAQEQHKEITGLETVQEQMGIFDKIPYAVQSKLLTNLVSKEAEARQEFQQLVTLYKAQKVEELRAVTATSTFAFPGYDKLLLDDRNQRWVGAIGRQATAHPTFFAVGAAHLGGPNGLVQLLRQQGYQVRPVWR